MIKGIGASDLLDDVGTIKSLWIRLHQNQPEMLDNFEGFLRRITSELERTHMNYQALQTAMENKRFAHDEEIRALYMEMESQISAEKERIRAEEKAKEKILLEKLKFELTEKDTRLQELLTYQSEMEKKLSEMNAVEMLAKTENEKLLKEKAAVEEMLDSSTLGLEESKSQIMQLQQLQRERMRKKSLAAAQINEWIILERESLLRQLQELKEINRKLLDNQDELESQHHVFNSRPHSKLQRHILENGYSETSEDGLDRQASYDEPDIQSSVTNNDSSDSRNGRNESLGTFTVDVRFREQPIGSCDNSEPLKDENYETVTNLSIPQRLYKVVFVGDSGVGKSSFIYRVCHQAFISSFAATIGVDLQVHSIKLDNQVIALQFWDTGGQERFRSFTKQYFRKADAVLVMYDVTCDTSFRRMREWLEGIKETVENETVIVVIGNKLDMIDEVRECGAINSRLGKKLANEYGALFFETSAKTGLNVNESVQHMARLLKEQEDKELKQDLSPKLSKSPSIQQRCCKF